MDLTIATITANPSVDRTIYLENIRLGGLNKVKRLGQYAGGKGINVSSYLADLGCQSKAFAFIGGTNGLYVRDYLLSRNIPAECVVVPGETRTNIKLIDEALQQTTEINEPGPLVDSASQDNMLQLINSSLADYKVMVVAGSLPEGVSSSFYKEIIRSARSHGALTILDTNGHNLREAAEAAPDMVKPNRAELEVFCGRKLSTIPELLIAAGQLLDLGVKVVLVSLGGEGSLLMTREKSWLVNSPQVDVVNTVGAGDSMVAAFALGLSTQGWEERLPEILLHAAACSLEAITKVERRLQVDLIQQKMATIRIQEVSNLDRRNFASQDYDAE